MISDRRRRQHRLGSGLIDATGDRYIVNIPKNASSFILDWTRRNRWSTTEHPEAFDLKEMIVVMRDPIERWISGFAQYAQSWLMNASRFFDPATGPGRDFQRKTGADFVQSYDWLAERLIFDNAENFDDHTWPQTYFFQDLVPMVPRRFFYLDTEWTTKFQNYLNLADPTDELDRNDSNFNADHRVIKDLLRQRINIVPELQTVIKQAYQQDYYIIKQHCS